MFKNIKLSQLFKILVLGIASFVLLITNHNTAQADGFDTLSVIVSASSSITDVVSDPMHIPRPDRGIRKIAAQSDDKVVATGWYLNGVGNGNFTGDMFRMDTDGELDQTFYGDDYYDSSRIFDLEILPNNTIVFIGNFEKNSFITPLFYKKSQSGYWDVTASFDGTPRAMDVNSIGQTYVVGNFQHLSGDNTANGIARFDQGQSRDGDFLDGSPGFTLNNSTSSLSDISIDLIDNSMYIVGDFDDFAGYATNAKIIKLDSTGARVSAFNPGTGFDVAPNFVKVDPNGKILVAGEFSTYKGVSVSNLVRLNIDGSLDTNFDSVGTGLSSVSIDWNGYGVKRLNKILFQQDGKMLLFTDSLGYDGNSSSGMVRINTNGSYDNTLVVGTGFNMGVKDAVFDSDGNIVVGGPFTYFNGQYAPYVVKLMITNDNTPPTLVSFLSPSNSGTYTPGNQIEITATFDQTLKTGSTLDVVLNTGKTLNLNTIVDNTNLSGVYTVQQGDLAEPLAITGFGSVNVSDILGNQKTTAYSSYVDLVYSKNIVIRSGTPVSTVVTETQRGGFSGGSSSSNGTIPLSLIKNPVIPVIPDIKTLGLNISNIPRYLKTNTKGDDVKLLQQFLNTKGFFLNTKGQAGSSGYETDYFGNLTKQALIKFQKAHDIVPATGYFGPITKAKIKSLSVK